MLGFKLNLCTKKRVKMNNFLLSCTRFFIRNKSENQNYICKTNSATTGHSFALNIKFSLVRLKVKNQRVAYVCFILT